jgi:hypothetical protein
LRDWVWLCNRRGRRVRYVRYLASWTRRIWLYRRRSRWIGHRVVARDWLVWLYRRRSRWIGHRVVARDWRIRYRSSCRCRRIWHRTFAGDGWIDRLWIRSRLGESWGIGCCRRRGLCARTLAGICRGFWVCCRRYQHVAFLECLGRVVETTVVIGTAVIPLLLELIDLSWDGQDGMTRITSITLIRAVREPIVAKDT